MNIANALTVIRILLTPVFVYCIYQPGFMPRVLAFNLFLLAAITDFLDGYLARKYQLVTAFGKIADPIADKVLMLSAFFVLAQMDMYPFWMFALIAVREIGITAYRFYAMSQGRVLAAENLGKCKTVAQFAAVFVMLFVLTFQQSRFAMSIDGNIFYQTHLLIQGLMFAATVLTVVSGISIIKK